MFRAFQLKLQEQYSRVSGYQVQRLIQFLFFSSDEELGPKKYFIMVISYKKPVKFKREREKKLKRVLYYFIYVLVLVIDNCAGNFSFDFKF